MLFECLKDLISLFLAILFLGMSRLNLVLFVSSVVMALITVFLKGVTKKRFSKIKKLFRKVSSNSFYKK